MTQSSMPWPAVAYDKLASQASLIQKDLVPEIPCLVLAEASGRVLSHSGPSGKGSTPEKVLADLDRVLTSGSSALAQTPRATRSEHGHPGCAANRRLACCCLFSRSAGETPARHTAETAVLQQLLPGLLFYQGPDAESRRLETKLGFIRL